MLKYLNDLWLDQEAAAIAGDRLETLHYRSNLPGADFVDVAVLHPSWLPWQLPGFELGLMLRDAVNNNPGCEGIRLGGHGLFTWSATQRESYLNRSGRAPHKLPGSLPTDSDCRAACGLGPGKERHVLAGSSH